MRPAVRLRPCSSAGPSRSVPEVERQRGPISPGHPRGHAWQQARSSHALVLPNPQVCARTTRKVGSALRPERGPDPVRLRRAAAAFLDVGPWTRDALLGRAVDTVGREPWLPALAQRAVDVYPKPPREALGEFVAALLEPEPTWTPGHGPGNTTEAVVAARWPVVPLPTVGSVAEWLGLTQLELDWFADLRRLERQAPDAVQHYRRRWLTRAGRVPRLIEAPKPRLRAVQRRILRSVLDPVPVADAAHGFVRRRSVVTAAAPHVGREVLVQLDLETFFGSIPMARVAGVFRSLGYRPPVAQVLAGLTTTTTPAAVRRRMPATAADLVDARWRLGRRLGAPHLPQGAPTSPAVANLVCWRLDRRLTGLARSYDATYTRYADDLVFSGGHGLRAARRLVEVIADVVADEGFTLVAAKTRQSLRSERQQVCGVVVNERVNAPRDEYDRLKAVLHAAARTGLAAQNRDGLPHYRDHLRGRIAWLAMRSPGRADRLTARLAAIPD